MGKEKMEKKKDKKNDGWVIRVQLFPEDPEDGKIGYFAFDVLYFQDRSRVRDLEKVIPTDEIQEGELELNEVQSIRRLLPLGDDFLLIIVPIYDHLYLIEVVDGAQHVSIFRSEEELNKYIKETYRVDLSNVRT